MHQIQTAPFHQPFHTLIKSLLKILKLRPLNDRHKEVFSHQGCFSCHCFGREVASAHCGMVFPTDPNWIVGLDRADDVGVYQVTELRRIIQRQGGTLVKSFHKVTHERDGTSDTFRSMAQILMMRPKE